MIKIIEAIAFRSTVEIDESGKLIRVPKNFSGFLNHTLSSLEETIKKSKPKFYSVTIEDVNETEFINEEI
jgi:hypothetical protein